MWLPDSPCISFKKDNVFVSWAMMLGYWVLYMNTVDLSLNCLFQRPIWPPYYWSSSNLPYLSYDLFRIVSLIFFMVISRLLFCPVAGLVVFFSQISGVSLSVLTPLFALSNPDIRQCNSHDPCESDSTSLDLSVLRMNSTVWATSKQGCPLSAWWFCP